MVVAITSFPVSVYGKRVANSVSHWAKLRKMKVGRCTDLDLDQHCYDSMIDRSNELRLSAAEMVACQGR